MPNKFEILGVVQEQANDQVQDLDNKLPTRGDFPMEEAVVGLKGKVPSEESIKKDFEKKPIEEEPDPEPETEEKVLTGSELWMQDNFPVIHKNQGFIIEFQLTDGFPDDGRYRRYIGNPEGKWSTSIKKRKSKKDRKKYGNFEEIFNKSERKGLNNFHANKDWPIYINQLETRLGLTPTYSGPPLDKYNYQADQNEEVAIDKKANEPPTIPTPPEEVARVAEEVENNEIKEKVKKYKKIKDKIVPLTTKVTAMKGDLTKLTTQCTTCLTLGTTAMGISNVLGKMDKVLASGAKAGESTTKSMKATFPSHPGPGNTNVADTTRATDDIKNESQGFAANLGQQLKNLGDFLSTIIAKIKEFLKRLIPLLKAIIAILALLAFLQQLTEISFLGFLKKSSQANQGEDKAELLPTESPEDFLSNIGYPGFEDKKTTAKDSKGNKLKDGILEEEIDPLINNPAVMIKPANITNKDINTPIQGNNTTLQNLENITNQAATNNLNSIMGATGTNTTGTNTTEITGTTGINTTGTTPPNETTGILGTTSLNPPTEAQKALEDLKPALTINTSDIKDPIISGIEDLEDAIKSQEQENQRINKGGIETPLVDNLIAEKAEAKDLTLNNQVIMGTTPIGTPITDNTLNFKNHSLLGDISQVHPHIINELYEEGIIPKEQTEEIKVPSRYEGSIPDYTKYEDQLANFYEKTLNDLQITNQIEYIKKIYNAKFEYVGYRRYRA